MENPAANLDDLIELSVGTVRSLLIGLQKQLEVEVNRRCEAEEKLADLSEKRGRCKRHAAEPGPSIYFDCCESERLRDLLRRRDAEIEMLKTAAGKELS